MTNSGYDELICPVPTTSSYPGLTVHIYRVSSRILAAADVMVILSSSFLKLSAFPEKDFSAAGREFQSLIVLGKKDCIWLFTDDAGTM